MTISLAWVTPFGRSSDVSAFSRNLLIELSTAVAAFGGSITVFVNENGANYWTPLPVIRLTGGAEDREMLASFDFVIFNIGNNSGNHGYINWLAIEVPGIVIVHDMVMQHFLAEEIFERYQRRDFYARVIGEYYGESGLATIGHSRICGDIGPPIYAPWDTLHVTDIPLLEPFFQSAAAVIVHSAYAERFVSARFAGPILRLALPWDQKPSLSDHELKAWRNATINRATMLVVCFGYIGRSKCLDLVIAAFAESDLLRGAARLTIAGYPGDLEYVEDLKSMVHACGLNAVVEFEFSVSDDRLLKLKQNADLFVNLRFPNTESASGSMVEQMNAGKPVLVYPSGCYAEIDAGAAIFVQREDGVQGVVRALEAIVRDPEARISVGENGRLYARRTGRSEYVAALLDFLGDNACLLRARKQISVRQRMISMPLDRTNENDVWMECLIRTRRLFSELHRPKHELSVVPFQNWDQGALISFVTIGLFGQSSNSPFERECRALFSRSARPDFYRIISITKIYWLLCKDEMCSGTGDLLRSALLSPMLCPDVFVLLRSFGDESLPRALYVGILGRWPATEEVSACVRGLSFQPVEKMIRDFISSEEFERRGAAKPAVQQLLDWCDQEHFCALDRQGLDYGSTVRFSSSYPDSRSYLGSGWHPIEEGQVWSRGPISTLVFSVPDEFVRAELALTITGRVTGAAFTGPRSLKFGCNGAAEHVVKVADDDWVSFDLDLCRLPNGSNEFVIVCDAGSTINLAATGIGTDTRALGFCLQSIRLCRREFALTPLKFLKQRETA